MFRHSRVSKGRGIAAIAAAIGVVASSVLWASPASADPVISFQTTGPVEVAFGGDWLIVLSVASAFDGVNYPLGGADGTVDVSLSGIPGIFASALPIQAGGIVYLAQSISKPLLPAGEYQVSAIFNPAPGTFLETAQTTSSLVLKVTALELTPAVTVESDARVSEHPVITATLGGSYVDANGGAPAGTWHFEVAKQGASEPVYAVDLAQAAGESEPLRLEIDKKLEKGASYGVNSTFTPVSEIAGGVTVAEVASSSFDVPEGTLGEALAAPLPLPLWAYLALLVVLLGLIATTIVFGVRLRGRTPVPVAVGPAAAQRLPGDPFNVEVVSLEDMGLPDPSTIPELLPEGEETKKLPTSTTWLLSDVEPATGLPNASEAPTERIDAVGSAELATELINTGPTEASTEKLSTSETKQDETKQEKDS